MEHGISALYTNIQHGYFLLLLCLKVLLILKSVTCNHIRLYYVTSQVAMYASGCGRIFTVADRSEAFFAIDEFGVL